jgi:ABC-2 type transport system ATP-binding protein
MSGSTDPAIETFGLRKLFEGRVAVADLSLEVRRGEVFGFLGPNGGGKTTSIKMLLGLVAPTAGSASVLGKPVGNVQIRAKVGFLPEHFRFHEWLTGREMLQFHGHLYRIPPRLLKARIQELLIRVDLLEAADRKIRGYSKGMMQRIGLAQALLNRPDLVFLDEPTSGLDPLGRLLVRNLIEELRQQGTTIFLNSHLLGEVEISCDRVAFVKDGQIVHEADLKDESSSLDVEIRMTPITSALLNSMGAFGSDVCSKDSIVRLRIPDDEKLPLITQWLVGQGVKVYEIRTSKKSLETLFMEIMGQDQRPG